MVDLKSEDILSRPPGFKVNSSIIRYEAFMLEVWE